MCTVLVNVALEPANCELIISMSEFDKRSLTFKYIALTSNLNLQSAEMGREAWLTPI